MKTVSEQWQSGFGGKLFIGCGGLIILLLSIFILLALVEIVAPNNLTKQIFSLMEFDSQTSSPVMNPIVNENTVAPDPDSIVPNTPQETAYQVFKAYLENDEATMASLMGEYATNECKQNYGSLTNCIDSNFTSRGLQTLQEWRVTGEDPNAADEFVYFAFVTTYWAEENTCLHLVFDTVPLDREWVVVEPFTEVRECQ